MKVGFECGGQVIDIDGDRLVVNGKTVAVFAGERAAERFARALNDYGDAMYAEGYVAAGMEAL